MSRPPCFPDDQTWASWRRFTRQYRPGRSGHCEDCTPDYQAKMLEQGRCTQPDIEWRVVDGFVEGHLPTKNKKMKREVLTGGAART